MNFAKSETRKKKPLEQQMVELLCSGWNREQNRTIWRNISIFGILPLFSFIYLCYLVSSSAFYLYQIMLFCRCLLVLVTTAVNCYILRRSCLQYANFSYIRENAVLQGSVIRTLMNKSPEACETECIGEYLCKSINLENANQRACELNRYSEADVADGKTLTKKTGWTFKSTDYSDLLVCFWTCFLLISF